MPFDIKKRRTEMGLTLEEVGQLVGVSKGTVKKWESGYIKNMRRDKLVRLADALRVSPIAFLTELPNTPILSEQKKVPLTEKLQKKYVNFILSVFGIKKAVPAIIMYKDSDLIFIESDNAKLEEVLKILKTGKS